MTAFSVSRQLLSDALSVVSRAVSSRTALPVLEGIRITAASNGTLTLTGYDLELGISTVIEAVVESPGELVLGARMLLDIVRRMPEERVSFKADDKFLTEIHSGSTEFTILGFSAEEFPDFPAVEEADSFDISQLLLREMIGQTLYAVATADAKPVHTGSLFDIKNSVLNLVSVDGYRLALCSEAVSSDRDLRFIVPGKALGEVSRILSDDDEQTVGLHISRRHITFKMGGFLVVSRLLEGEFLDYRAAIPGGFTTEVKVGVRAFSDCIERASLLINDRIKSPLRVAFEDGDVKINCQTALGKAYDEMRAVQNGENVEIGFNNRYLLDALRASGCDEVRLEISGPLSPMKMRPVEGDAFTFLVLPVRLQRTAD